jgi:diacylglycerol kinase family enzyme
MSLVSEYADGVSELTNYTKEPQPPPLMVDLIVNPVAGFFKKESTLRAIITELKSRLQELKARFPKRKIELNTVHYTRFSGHARQITDNIIKREVVKNSGLDRLIIGAGGDGTSNEICTSLVHADDSVLRRIKLLRFPLGTGNDIADGDSFADVYNLILGPQNTVLMGSLLIELHGYPPLHAFNIASLGIDAYIASLSNAFKRVIPGDAYKAMVDVAVLFYEMRVKPKEMVIQISEHRSPVESIVVSPMMVIMGVSGNRTYGKKKRILPGGDNICVVGSMGLLRKVFTKKLFYTGDHVGLEEVSFYTGDKIKMEYSGIIPLQFDGEVRWLTADNFPLNISKQKPHIRVVAKG